MLSRCRPHSVEQVDVVQAVLSAPPLPPAPASVTLPPAVLAPAATAASLAAMRAALEADRAAAQVQAAALQAQMDKQAADTQQILVLLAALRPASTPAPVVPGTTVPSAAPAGRGPAQRSDPSSASVSASHRAAVLDHSAAAAASANPYGALTDVDSDEEAHEVTPQSHTRAQPTSVLPAAFVPAPPGTEQSAQQQLAAIVNGLSKQGTKVKYSTVAELDEALDDWATASRKAHWSTAQVESIRAYQRLLINDFTISQRRPLKEVLDYHRRWCKAVDDGTIDMFAAGAEMNLTILFAVEHPRSYGHTQTAATPASKGGRPRAPAPTSNAAGSTPPAAAKHPTGSCTYHPASTTHTTAECKKKG